MMPRQNFTPAPPISAARFIIFVMLAIFIAELAVMELFNSVFTRLGAASASLLDAAILATFFAVPFWGLLLEPLFAEDIAAGRTPRSAPRIIMLKAVAAIFTVEFLIMYALSVVCPHVDGAARNLADAGITALSITPLFWFILPPEKRFYFDKLINLLHAPVKLFIILIVSVFMIDLLEMALELLVSPYATQFSAKLTDAFLTTLLISPLLWVLVISPLRRAAIFEKSFSDAIRNQVVEAIVTLNYSGKIEACNLAAEEIFGYREGEIVGKSADILFCEDLLKPEALGRIEVAAGKQEIPRTSHEVVCRKKDGSLLIMEISTSRVVIDTREQFLVFMRDVSNRKKMEEALRESGERFQLAIEGSNDGIWDWNIQTGVIYHSPRLKELLGYQDEELPGMIGTFESLLHPEDHDRVMEFINSHLGKGSDYETEYRLRCRSGEYRWFRARGQAVWDESGRAVRMAGSISDITLHKEAENSLRQSEARFRQLFEQSEDAIIFFKPDTCTIIDANKTAERLYGFTVEELKSRGIECFCKPEDGATFGDIIRDIRDQGISYLGNMAHLRKDEMEIIVSVYGKTINIQGVDLIYCSFRDITERVRMEEESKNIQAKLIQANKMTSLGLLVSGVAHEINNPNNSIMANSQMLDRAWQDALKILREYYRENGDFQLGGMPFSTFGENSQHLFAGITDGARRINEIVNNLKGYARADRIPAGEDVSINQVVTAAVNILHYQLIRYTDRFHLELDEDIPGVKGSSQQLVQVVTNLVMNACQSIPGKECGIWVTTGFDKPSGQVMIIVRDEGHGIPETVSSKILEPFFTTRLDDGGTGLGLFITQSIIREHNGTLEFTSEPGRGTTFIVKIPAAAVVAEEHAP